MRVWLLAAVFAVLLTAGCVGSGSAIGDPVAAKVCSVGKTGQSTFLPYWFVIASLALVVSAALLGLVYMFAMLFTNQNLAAFVKFELLELGVTAVIILLVGMIVGSLCLINVKEIFTSIDLNELYGSGPQYTDMYDVVFQYFQYLDSRIIGWMTANHLMVMNLDQIASTTIYSKPLGMGMVTSPGAGFAGPLKNILAQMTNAMAVAFIMNHAQYKVLQFAIYSMMNYWLPIGIILRAFVPTRRIGGTLIALALGFLLIYPLLTLLTANVVLAQVTSTNTGIWNLIGNNIAGASPGSLGTLLEKSSTYQDWTKGIVSGELIKNNQATNPGAQATVNCNTVPDSEKYKCYNIAGEPGLGASMLGVLSGITNSAAGASKQILFTIIMIPSSAVSMAFIAGIVMPAINVLIFVQAMKSLSKSLGEEIDITALTRMI